MAKSTTEMATGPLTRDARQLIRDTSPFKAVPGVMSDFRKVCFSYVNVCMRMVQMPSPGVLVDHDGGLKALKSSACLC